MIKNYFGHKFFLFLLVSSQIAPIPLAQAGRSRFNVWNNIQVSHPVVADLLRTGDRTPSSIPGAGQSVLAPACDYPPKVPQFPLNNLEITSSTVSLKAPAYYMKDLLAILSATKVGKPIAQQFLPAFEAGTIPVLLATHEEIMAHFNKDSIVAFCEISGGKRKIYIDKTAETGTVAPIFLHELVHCLDVEQIQHEDKMKQVLSHFNEATGALLTSICKRTGKKPEQLAKEDFNSSELVQLRLLGDEVNQFAHLAHFRTERKAYDAGYAIAQELIRLYPDYYQKASPFLRAVLGPVSDEQIIERYDLHSPWVEAYKRGQCKAP